MQWTAGGSHGEDSKGIRETRVQNVCIRLLLANSRELLRKSQWDLIGSEGSVSVFSA